MPTMQKSLLPAGGPHRLPLSILGVPFDPVTTVEAIQIMERMIASRRAHYVVTPNVDFVVQAQADVELRRILFDADLVLCDGTPLVWASRLLGAALPERVAGADVVPQLIQVAAEKGYRLFLLGAAPESAQRAVENLRRDLPVLRIAGHYSPPFRPLLEMDHAEIVARVREAQPDILLVSFGCPKQEKWMAMNYRALNVPVCMGVGATIDFLAGQVRRAPAWMQRSGTEWLFRLAQEPRRLFRRYARDFGVFGWRMLVQWTALGPERCSPSQTGLDLHLPIDPHWRRLALPMELDATVAGESDGILQQIMESGTHCLVDGSRVRRVDSPGLGLLVRLAKLLRRSGKQMVLVAPARALRRALKLLRLQDFFLTAPNLPAAIRLLDSCANETAVPVALRTALSGNVLVWRGEITAGNSRNVWLATEQQFSRARKSDWVIDLSRVRHLDSSGVEIMQRVERLADECGARVSFVQAAASVRNTLRRARAERFLRQRPPPHRREVRQNVGLILPRHA